MAASIYHGEQHLLVSAITLVIIFILLIMAVIAISSPEEQYLHQFLVACGTVAVVLLIFAFIRLSITVENQMLRLYLRPFWSENIAISDIISVEAVEYRPLRDFGGWGLRIGQRGRIISARGNRAVKLQLASGKTLFVGTGNPERLASSLSG